VVDEVGANETGAASDDDSHRAEDSIAG
jgi:hypothetical protein